MPYIDHPFKVYSSVVFNIFTDRYIQLILEHLINVNFRTFSSSRKESPYSLAFTPLLPHLLIAPNSQPLGTANLLSVPIGFPVLAFHMNGIM